MLKAIGALSPSPSRPPMVRLAASCGRLTAATTRRSGDENASPPVRPAPAGGDEGAGNVAAALSGDPNIPPGKPPRSGPSSFALSGETWARVVERKSRRAARAPVSLLGEPDRL